MNEPGTGRPVVKHSAGPWEWWTSNSWKRLRRTERGISTNILMPCRLPGGGATIDVTDADMALIATAPELLEALKALQLQALQSNVNSPANDWGREALEMTRAVIAKATGTAGERP